MAKSPVCSIPDCSKSVYARGWCSAHYQKWLRHGDPEGGGTPIGMPVKFFNEVVLSHQSDDCLIWPYGKDGNGYATLLLCGKRGHVHRFVCEAKNGPPPFSKAEAAHSCGNGHLGCVNQQHLRWKTRTENQNDRIIHGTSPSNPGEKNGNAKLTEADVLKIRSLENTATTNEIARQFSIHFSTVRSIILRKKWNHIPG
jgi:hypothetical protein